MTCQIIIEPAALKCLKKISDRRIQEKIRDRIEGLKVEPEKQGKALLGELSGYRSLRAVGQKYRIIYRMQKEKIIVFVVAVGIRKEGGREDIYELAKRLLKYRLV